MPMIAVWKQTLYPVPQTLCMKLTEKRKLNVYRERRLALRFLTIIPGDRISFSLTFYHSLNLN